MQLGHHERLCDTQPSGSIRGTLAEDLMAFELPSVALVVTGGGRSSAVSAVSAGSLPHATVSSADHSVLPSSVVRRGVLMPHHCPLSFLHPSTQGTARQTHTGGALRTFVFSRFSRCCSFKCKKCNKQLKQTNFSQHHNQPYCDKVRVDPPTAAGIPRGVVLPCPCDAGWIHCFDTRDRSLASAS